MATSLATAEAEVARLELELRRLKSQGVAPKADHAWLPTGVLPAGLPAVSRRGTASQQADRLETDLLPASQQLEADLLRRERASDGKPFPVDIPVWSMLQQKRGELVEAELAAAAAARDAELERAARREERESWKWRLEMSQRDLNTARREQALLKAQLVARHATFAPHDDAGTAAAQWEKASPRGGWRLTANDLGGGRAQDTRGPPQHGKPAPREPEAKGGKAAFWFSPPPSAPPSLPPYRSPARQRVEEWPAERPPWHKGGKGKDSKKSARVQPGKEGDKPQKGKKGGKEGGKGGKKGGKKEAAHSGCVRGYARGKPVPCGARKA